ncbi:MAG: DMT family transporter [Castellaniella sp.]
MSWLSLGLVVTAAFLHASWNLASKRAAGAGAVFVFFYRIWSGILYLPWVLWLLHDQAMSWSGMAILFVGLSTLIHLGYSLSLMKGYQKADLSIVYPVARGTGPLLASIVAILWLGESIHLSKALGILGVVCGILLIATQGQWKMFRSPQSWVGIRWGLCIGTFIAAYSVVDAYSVKVLLVAPVILDWISSLGGAMLLAPGVWSERAQLRKKMKGNWLLAFFVGLVSPLAYILVLYALRLGADVSQVAPLREMSMIVATLVGALILREQVSAGRWLGCVAILTGVILIATS